MESKSNYSSQSPNRRQTQQKPGSPTMIKSVQQRNQAIDKSMRRARDDYNNPEARNPFRFIEAALGEAKGKIEKMKATPQILESLPDNEKKKKYLKAENKLLRENLKRMSDNVNILIEKMNSEQQKKTKAQQAAQARAENGGDVPFDQEDTRTKGSPSARSKYASVSMAEASAANTDKAIVNLVKEH